MDVITEIDYQNKIRKYRVIGSVTYEGLKSYLLEMYDAPDFDNSLYSLWDLSHAEGIDNLTTEEIRVLVLLVGSKWNTSSRVKSALVVSRELEYGLARMYEIQLSAASDNEIRVFKDLEEATRWIVGSKQ